MHNWRRLGSNEVRAGSTRSKAPSSKTADGNQTLGAGQRVQLPQQLEPLKMGIPFPKLFFVRAHFSHDVQKKHLEVWHTNLLKRIEILYTPNFQKSLTLILNCIIPILIESQCSWLSFFPTRSQVSPQALLK